MYQASLNRCMSFLPFVAPDARPHAAVMEREGSQVPQVLLGTVFNAGQ